MAKLDVPCELKEFDKVFQRLSYGLTDSEVFDDFLLWIIAGFSYDIKWEPRYKYTKEQTMMFLDLFSELVNTMQMMLKKQEWYDPFGSIYESSISSHGRRCGAGQFFTPCTVVDFMVEIQCIGTKIEKELDDLTGAHIHVSDPTCGSGRMLVAFHAKNPGNFLYGEDIDRTCCLMTVCNILIHGGVGEVVWHDSLDPDSWYDGWYVNWDLNRTGIPTVRKIAQSESFIYRSWQNRKLEIEKKKDEKEYEIIEDVKPVVEVNPPVRPGTQLSFFFE